jgi:peptidoglycan hydrolase-like protein with peptidoglycan-binding domain
MVYPLSDPTPGVKMRSGFGWRVHPITGKRTMHRGIDYGGVFDVMSAGDGKVVYVAPEWNTLSPTAKRKQSGGNVIIIQHAADCYTAYYHGAYQSPLKVGQRVKTGDVLYRSGTTGLSTGNHLHFEVRTKQHSGHVDPVPYLRAGSNQPTHNMVQVTGKPDRQSWRALQTALRPHGYTGIIDGIPGPMTYRALQTWAGVKADGIFGPETRRAVQRKLGVTADGIWGRMTWTAIQQRINSGNL